MTEQTAVVEPGAGVAMVADVMCIVPKHPRIDPVRGVITGWNAGKVKPGDKTNGRFTWRGPLHEAPMGAHCEKPEDQERLVEARRAFKEQQEMAGLAKKAEAAAMAAQAAASIFKDTPQAQAERDRMAQFDRRDEAEPPAPAVPSKGKARTPGKAQESEQTVA